MGHAKNDIIDCCKCGESDYSDMMHRIDGKIYCQICAEEFETKMIEQNIKGDQDNDK